MSDLLAIAQAATDAGIHHRFDGPYLVLEELRAVVVDGGGPDDHPTVWMLTVQQGLQHVTFLPDATGWLLDRIAQHGEAA